MFVKELKHTSRETYLKQLQIVVFRTEAKLQARYHGQIVSTNTAFNTNHFFGYLEPDLKSRNIEIRKRGYVYKAWIDENNYDIFGENVDLAVVEEPDIDTMSDGTRTTASEVLLTWSQYSLKLKLECVVQATQTF